MESDLEEISPRSAQMSFYMEQIYENTRSFQVENDDNDEDDESQAKLFAHAPTITATTTTTQPLGISTPAARKTITTHLRDNAKPNGLDNISIETSRNVDSQLIIPPPELCSLKECGTPVEPFSCFSLSLSGGQGNANGRRQCDYNQLSSGEKQFIPKFDITANMPSQVLPNSSLLSSSGGDGIHQTKCRIEESVIIVDRNDECELMPPPAFIPIKQSQQDDIVNIPLSIPDHFDIDGNLISLSGVVSMKKPDLNLLQTPKLSVTSRDKVPIVEETPVLDAKSYAQNLTMRSSGESSEYQTTPVASQRISRLENIRNFERTPMLPSLDLSMGPCKLQTFSTAIAFNDSNSRIVMEDESLPHSIEIVNFRSEQQIECPESPIVVHERLVESPKHSEEKDSKEPLIESKAEDEDCSDMILVNDSYSLEKEPKVDIQNPSVNHVDSKLKPEECENNFSVACSLDSDSGEEITVINHVNNQVMETCANPTSENEFAECKSVNDITSEISTGEDVTGKSSAFKSFAESQQLPAIRLDYQPSQLFEFEKKKRIVSEGEKEKKVENTPIHFAEKELAVQPVSTSNSSTPKSNITDFEKFLSKKTPSKPTALTLVTVAVQQQQNPANSTPNVNINEPSSTTATENIVNVIINSNTKISKTEQEETQETQLVKSQEYDSMIKDIVSAYEDKSRCLSEKSNTTGNFDISNDGSPCTLKRKETFKESNEKLHQILDQGDFFIKSPIQTKRCPSPVCKTPRRIVMSSDSEMDEDVQDLCESPLVRHDKIVDLYGSQDLTVDLDEDQNEKPSISRSIEDAATILSAYATPARHSLKSTPSFAVGDRVWALRKSDDCFHAGTIVTVFCDGVFGIQFEYGEADHILSSDLRHLKLEAGDMVQFKPGASLKYESAVINAEQDDGSFILTTLDRKMYPNGALVDIRLLRADMELLQSKRDILNSRPSSAYKVSKPVSSEAVAIPSQKSKIIPMAKKSKKPRMIAQNNITPKKRKSITPEVKKKQTAANKRVKVAKTDREPEPGNSNSLNTAPAKKTRAKNNALTVTTPKRESLGRNCKSKENTPKSCNKKLLFDGYQFIITGIDKSKKSGGEKCADILKSKIENLGGEVIQIEDVDKCKRTPKETVLISSKPCRTTKYFFALAKCIPKVREEWVDICISKAEIVNMENYHLSNGFDIDENEVNFVFTERILENRRFYMYSPKISQEEKNQWALVIKAAGGEIVSKQNSPNVDYFVSFVDTLAKSMRNPELFVTKEWLCQCLIQQKLLPTDEYSFTASIETSGNDKKKKTRRAK